MRVVSLASGSTGNALLIEAGPQARTKLLIDAGLSARLLTQRLQSVGVRLSQLQGVLVTHEHSDHVLGLPMLVKRYAIPVISDPRTSAAIEESIRTGGWRTDSGRLVFTGIEGGAESEAISQAAAFRQSITEYVANGEELLSKQETTSLLLEATIDRSLPVMPAIALPVGSQRTIGDVTVTSFPVSHDAVAPCGYLVQGGGCRVCVVIDSGEVTPAMLHLSNDQTAGAVLRAWRRDRIRWLWLAHLSRTNNTPSLALDSIHMHLQGAHVNLSHTHISALPPGMGPVWDSTQLWHISSSEVSRRPKS